MPLVAVLVGFLANFAHAQRFDLQSLSLRAAAQSGAFACPDQVSNFIVRILNHLLKSQLLGCSFRTGDRLCVHCPGWHVGLPTRHAYADRLHRPLPQKRDLQKCKLRNRTMRSFRFFSTGKWRQVPIKLRSLILFLKHVEEIVDSVICQVNPIRQSFSLKLLSKA